VRYNQQLPGLSSEVERSLECSQLTIDLATVGGSMRFVTDGQGRATHFFLTIVEGDVRATRK
jgi:hypothetical protein